jgi:DNA primase catalytic subunit
MNTTIIIDDYSVLEDVKKYILEFNPEGVYYDRNIYSPEGSIKGQELAFDLDPENVISEEELKERMERKQGLSFTIEEFERVKQETIRLFTGLEKIFEEMKIVYSGRGFHIHVFDKEAYNWNRETRKELAENLRDNGAPIDTWVTTGGSRLIRLPYSLNGLVSRIVLPLTLKEVKSFNPLTDERCIPRFLKTS